MIQVWKNTKFEWRKRINKVTNSSIDFDSLQPPKCRKQHAPAHTQVVNAVRWCKVRSLLWWIEWCTYLSKLLVQTGIYVCPLMSVRRLRLLLSIEVLHSVQVSYYLAAYKGKEVGRNIPRGQVATYTVHMKFNWRLFTYWIIQQFTVENVFANNINEREPVFRRYKLNSEWNLFVHT